MQPMTFEEWFNANNLSGIPTHELRRFKQTWDAAQKAMRARAESAIDGAWVGDDYTGPTMEMVVGAVHDIEVE